MKNKGNISKYEIERNRNLLELYERFRPTDRKTDIRKIAQHIYRMPAKRFWVSPSRASIVISDMMKGNDLKMMRPLKKEMYEEIYRRVMILKKKHPKQSMMKLVDTAIRQPAPKFYLSEMTIMIILYKILSGWYEKRKAN